MVTAQTGSDGEFEFPFLQLFRKVLLEATIAPIKIVPK